MTGPFRHDCAGIVRGTSTVSPFGLRSGRAELVYRGRLELVSAPLPQQAYHAAAEGGLSLSQAEDLVRRWLDGATANARDGLRKVASAAVWAGGELHACALFGQPRPLPSLERILS